MWHLCFIFLITLRCVQSAGIQGSANKPAPMAGVSRNKYTPAPNQRASSNAHHDDDDEDKSNIASVLHGEVSSSAVVPGQSLNELLGSIFSNYHKELVPRRPTTVKMDMLLLKVKSTVEKEGIFESVVALFIEWIDPRLQWNPTFYDNVSILAFDSDKVWLPDIAMTNSADHLYSISKDTRFVVRVSHDGAMKFVPTGTARTWCDLKLLTFPFDVQMCSLEFESWSLDSSTMTFNTSSDALVDDAFSSPQWALCKRQAIVYDHYYNFTGETFTRVRFDFMVRRKSTFYIINLIFPCATLSLIQLLVFVIPSTDSTSDRVGFGTTNLLTLVVFQTIVTEEMPKSSDAVTALSKYIIALIIISAVGIFESVIAERMLRTTASPPPRFASAIMNIFPMLWSSQLPTGITAMILEGDIDDRNFQREEKDRKKRKRKKKLKKMIKTRQSTGLPNKADVVVRQEPGEAKVETKIAVPTANRPQTLNLSQATTKQSLIKATDSKSNQAVSTSTSTTLSNVAGKVYQFLTQQQQQQQTLKTDPATAERRKSLLRMKRERSFIFSSLTNRIDKSLSSNRSKVSVDNQIYYQRQPRLDTASEKESSVAVDCDASSDSTLKQQQSGDHQQVVAFRPLHLSIGGESTNRHQGPMLSPDEVLLTVVNDLSSATVASNTPTANSPLNQQVVVIDMSPNNHFYQNLTSKNDGDGRKDAEQELSRKDDDDDPIYATLPSATDQNNNPNMMMLRKVDPDQDKTSGSSSSSDDDDKTLSSSTDSSDGESDEDASSSSSSSSSDKSDSDLTSTQQQQRDQMLRIKNGRLWGVLVTQLDSMTFASCFVLALGIPLGLFLPLIFNEDKCPLSHDGR